MELISLKWLLVLAGAAAWTVFFSLFNNPGVRGWRNLGWIACYLLGLAMAVVLPWRAALVTWSLAGLTSGLVYFAYELFAYIQSPAPDAKPRAGTLLNGLFLWPIMLPEAIEYWLADLGILKAVSPTPPKQT
jgi:hypothetical protein